MLGCAVLAGCAHGESGDSGSAGDGGEGGSGGSGTGGSTTSTSTSTSASTGGGGTGGEGTVTLIKGCAEFVPSDECTMTHDEAVQACDEATLGAYPFPYLCVKDAIQKCVWIGITGVNCSWATDAYLYCCPCD